ncbi:MAG: choice-of-anchor D domain-containing protein [Bradymonadia bacterium]
MVGTRTSYLIVACVLFSALGCGERKQTRTPLFSADPAEFTFPKLGIGQPLDRVITITNRGSGVLIISDVALEDESTAAEFTFGQLVDGELIDVPDVLEIDSESSILFQVTYNPSDELIDTGRVTLTTNDPEALNVTLPISVGGQAGEISVTPRTLDFGRVEVNESADRNLSISNIGIAPLVITRMSVQGRADFTARIGDNEALGDSLDEPIVIQPDETIDVTVTFAPMSALRADSELLITSNAVNAPTVSVGLIANGALPCLAITPESLDFGSGLIVEEDVAETPNQLPVTLESCGTASLRIDRVEFDGNTDAFVAVNLPEPSAGEPLYELPAALPGEASPAEQMLIGFRPTAVQAYGGQATIYSNAPESPHIIDLFGRGVDNQCPVPITTTERYDVPPLDIVTLDGSPSMDPGGAVERWEWTVVERPDGSTSQPVESFADIRRPADGGEADVPTTPTAQFFVDLAGRYTIELRVVDNLGQSSSPGCQPPVATVVIEAVPEKDLHVQLVWSTPDDPDESDQFGTDVDLHFKHQLAGDGWGAAANGYDVYFRNTTPDWGNEGDVADNPSLDIDDTNGAGPENVNLASPEVGVTYEVGAIYFRNESTFGDAMNDPRRDHPSYITVRIFARGELLNEFVGREMNEARQLWHVASIEWCEDALRCPDITIRDQLYSEGEYRSQ